MDSFDISFEDLTKSIFSKEPFEPYTFYMEFLTDIDSQKLSEMLGYFIQYGSKQLFNCELAQLTDKQSDTLQNYLKSIGYVASFVTNETFKKVIDYNPDGTPFEKSIPIKSWNITFEKTELPIKPGGCGDIV